MHVIIACKYEKDQMKNSREKVETPFFPSLPYLLTWKPVVGSGRISNSSKLSCMLSLPANMKRIRSRTAEKKWRHHFSHYKPIGIFLDVQGQLTPLATIHHDSSRFELDGKIGVHRDGKKKIQHQYCVSRCSYGVCTIHLRITIHDGSATIHHSGAINAHNESKIRYGASTVQAGSATTSSSCFILDESA